MEAAASFIPLLTLLAFQAAFAVPICGRKGAGVGWLILCVLPALGTMFLILVASRTDQKVLEELSDLRSRIG